MNELVFSIPIDALYETLEKTSEDKANKETMTDSKMWVINFDNFKEKYLTEYGVSKNRNLSSCDALFIGANALYLIEFKNGKLKDKVERLKIRKKVSDSLLMLLDTIGKDVHFAKNNIHLILVYNEQKNGMEMFEGHIKEKSGDKFDPVEISGYEKIWFKSVHTYAKEIFRTDFVKKFEDE